MYYRIAGEQKVTAGTDAVTVHAGYRKFLLRNNSESATVFFRDSGEDGAPASSERGFPVKQGECIWTVLMAEKLSVAASADGADVRILWLDEG